MTKKSNDMKKRPKTPGECLAKVRVERGYTQSSLSRAMGIRQSVISEYELGRVRLHAEVLIRFADFFGVSVDELLGRRKQMGRPPTPPIMKILRRMEKLQALPETRQAEILKVLDLSIEGARKRAKK